MKKQDYYTTRQSPFKQTSGKILGKNADNSEDSP